MEMIQYSHPMMNGTNVGLASDISFKTICTFENRHLRFSPMQKVNVLQVQLVHLYSIYLI